METYTIANIARVDIVTEEATPKTYTLEEVASQAEASAFVSEGQSEELRVKNTIHAQIVTEDITKGYQIKLNNVRAVLEVLALVDGGNWDDTAKKYTGPVAGEVTERIPFTLKIYTEDLDYNGDVLNYIMFEYKHCKGKPVNFIQNDGEFATQELNLVARPKKGEPVTSFDVLPELPESA